MPTSPPLPPYTYSKEKRFIITLRIAKGQILERLKHVVDCFLDQQGDSGLVHSYKTDYQFYN